MQYLTIQQRKINMFTSLILLLDVKSTDINYKTVKGFNKLMKLVYSVTPNQKLTNYIVTEYISYKDSTVLINKDTLINKLIIFADSLQKVKH